MPTVALGEIVDFVGGHYVGDRNRRVKAVAPLADHSGAFAAWRSGSLHKAIRDNISAAPRKAERLALAFLRRQSRAEKRGRSRTRTTAR
jgi:hypothetical protein